MSSSLEVFGEDASNAPGGGDACTPSASHSLPEAAQVSSESGSQSGTGSFLQTLRQPNPEPLAFNDWNIRPPFSTATEPPAGIVGYHVTPFSVNNTNAAAHSNFTESGSCSTVVGNQSWSGTFVSTPESRVWSFKNRPEIYSRKLFVGGLPIDIDQDDLVAVFGKFGNFEIDWPRKSQSKAFYPPKGYVFLVFEQENSIHFIMENCFCENDKFFIPVSSQTTKDKPAQVRPWKLSDADFLQVDSNATLDPRKSVYLTGIPRPMKASELAVTMEKLFKGVCYAGIDMDPGLKYPSGAGRVAFKNRESYIAAISHKSVHLRYGDMDKYAFVTPYILDRQPCDICWSSAPYFCVDVSCLQYLCEKCWQKVHMRPGFESHKATVKEIYEKNRLAKARTWNSYASY